MDGRGEGPWHIRRPSRAGSPICHFLFPNKCLVSQISSIFFTGCSPAVGSPPQGNDGRRVNSHCRHRCRAGFCRQVSGIVESLGHWPVCGEGVVDWGSQGRETGGWEELPADEQLSLFGEAWRLEKPTSCREPHALAVTLVGWRPLPRFSRPPSCRGQRRLSPSPAPLLPPPAQGYPRGGGALAYRCAFTPLLSLNSWRAPSVRSPNPGK